MTWSPTRRSSHPTRRAALAAVAACLAASTAVAGVAIGSRQSQAASSAPARPSHRYVLLVDGVRTEPSTTQDTVGQALTEHLGADITQASTVSVPLDLPLFPDRVEVSVTTIKRVAISVGGKHLSVASNAGSVSALLAQQRITPRPRDLVLPAPSAPLTAGMTVTVERFSPGTQVRQEPIRHGTRTQPTDTLPAGQRQVHTGKDGLRTTAYQVITRNGKEVSRRVVSQDVTIPAVDTLILLGTRTASSASAGPSQSRAFQPQGDTVWDRLATCESGNNWQVNTGNGYYGGLQFDLPTWRGYGGTGYPHQHTREAQIAVAERLRAARGFAPWPVCARKLGLL